MWETIENKQKFISQIMTSKSPVRSAEDIDESVLTYAEVKALAAGNPLIKEKMNLDLELAKLTVARADYSRNIHTYQDELALTIPKRTAEYENVIRECKKDIAAAERTADKEYDEIPIVIFGKAFTDKKEAGEAILLAAESYTGEKEIGLFRGFGISVKSDENNVRSIIIKGAGKYSVTLGSDAFGAVTKLNNLVNNIPKVLREAEERLAQIITRKEQIETEIKKPFEREDEYRVKTARQKELDKLLSSDNTESADRNTTDTGRETVQKHRNADVKGGGAYALG